MFHGSYNIEDVTFLMQVIDLEETSIDEKELLIQNNEIHYSEMISPEYRPDYKYLELFHESMSFNLDRVTHDLLSLAKYYSTLDNPIIVSLARAGTPFGVIIKRMLNFFYNMDVPHYSISIIKDRGIDEIALLHILRNHPDHKITFLDGWVSKGSIAHELKKSIDSFNLKFNYKIDNFLYALSDISGNAYISVTNEDYLIPSSILNSVISGLISRSIFTSEIQKNGGFHGCKYYSELSEFDLSIWYVKKIMQRANDLFELLPININKGENILLQNNFNQFIEEFILKNNIKSKDYLKPGIGESTRALLRRVPKAVYVQNQSQSEINHILYLCKERNVEVIIYPDLPFKVMAIL